MSNQKKSLDISVEQAKLLGNALRVKIMKQLLNEPKTSKQVATQLGHSPGNVHYHLKKLHEGGLLELVEEKQFGGVVEKYYQAVASRFNSPGGAMDPVLQEGFNSRDSSLISIRLELTAKQRKDLQEEFLEFLESWVEKSSHTQADEKTEEFSVGVKIVSTEPKGEEE
ncbi:ArsR/SmtB family transcription factor [Alkalihalophilus marmarensis]|uniref:ArsR/SmtB family transcription factor n=1 Tax=Alkalihalophilus marmarensis TaxID=521377 RepID=UPI002DB70975|nr:winged helix-turn-helix domain-containing protein [Alkalihalophilus marmarensis]MEC2072548.1 winged helix-turn-helix domain-containing protein [Alkalihalophilus marmarensis]